VRKINFYLVILRVSLDVRCSIDCRLELEYRHWNDLQFVKYCDWSKQNKNCYVLLLNIWLYKVMKLWKAVYCSICSIPVIKRCYNLFYLYYILALTEFKRQSLKNNIFILNKNRMNINKQKLNKLQKRDIKRSIIISDS